ncbi:MAG TPA: hypothetical protein PLZ51_10395, partial [Aggregatilineales bacterium]|nr:hypothetical protein [Aggregatilineales bacterium]
MSVTSEQLARHQHMNANDTKGVLPMKLRFNRKRVSVLVALVAILTVAGGVLANSIFGFFNQAPTDTNNLQITYGQVDMNNIQMEVPAFFYTLEHAMSSTEYYSKAPQAIPSRYQFYNATYTASSGDLSQYYQCETSGITLSQRPLRAGEVFGGVEVGASATIIPVAIGDGGEYVRGGWLTDGNTSTLVLDSSAMNTMTNTTTNVNLTWSNDIPQHTLMWTENGILYTLQTSVTQGGCNLTQADILAIANSLK